MADDRTFVIVGGGVAGAKAADTLRAEGFDGRLVLVAAEPRLPYSRPPLSKGYLAGDKTFADAQVHDEAFYSTHAIELLTGTRATALDTAGHRLTLSDGSQLGYDRVLLATGAVPRRPPIDGVDGEHVHVLRSVADADALRAAIGDGARLVVLGAGWIGCEVAATARSLGADVTVIEAGAAPLERVLGARLGEFFARLHRARGVELLVNATVSAIRDGGRTVRLGDGRTLAADAVVLGVGVAPDTALAEASGLRVDNGIVADAQLRASRPDVFVAGDVASVMHARYGCHVRVEHWDYARRQGAAAARSMLGSAEAYAKPPFFFSQQYETLLGYIGLHDPADQLVIRGEAHDASFQAFWIAPDGTLSAGMQVNEREAMADIRELVEGRVAVDPARLADPAQSLLAGERRAA